MMPVADSKVMQTLMMPAAIGNYYNTGEPLTGLAAAAQPLHWGHRLPGTAQKHAACTDSLGSSCTGSAARLWARVCVCVCVCVYV